MSYNIRLENCEKLNPGEIPNVNASYVVNQLLKHHSTFEIPSRASRFYKLNGMIFEPSSIHSAVSIALNNIESLIKKRNLFFKMPEAIQNQMLLLVTLSLLTLEDHPFFYPNTCSWNTQYAQV